MTFMASLKADATAKLAGALNIKALSEGRATMYRVNPLVIEVIKGWNLRDMESDTAKAHVEYLAGLIADHGFIDEAPLKVRMNDGKIQLLGGHCRLAAVRLLLTRGHEIASVPVVLVPAGTTDQELVADMAGSDSAALPLTVLEQADGVKRLLAAGWTHAKIAARMAVSEPRIYQLIDVLKLPAEVKADIKTGIISASMAIKILKQHGEANGAAIVQGAVTEAKAEAAKAPAKGGKKQAPKVRSSHARNAAAKMPAATSAPAKSGNTARDTTAVTMLKKEIDATKAAIKAKFLAVDAKGEATTRVTAHNNGQVTVTFTQASFQAFKAAIGL